VEEEEGVVVVGRAPIGETGSRLGRRGSQQERHRSEAEGTPGVVEVVRIREADVAAASPASMATVRLPMRQHTPEKPEVSTPMSWRALTTISDTRGGDGVGRGCRTVVPPGPR
jgi:hypothetical protein